MQSTLILHSCPGYSQSQIIRLIIHIYGGVAEPFEVLRCQRNTTKEEIQLFLNPMRAMKRPFQFLILEVNKLAYQLQEVIIEMAIYRVTLLFCILFVNLVCLPFPYLYVRAKCAFVFMCGHIQTVPLHPNVLTYVCACTVECCTYVHVVYASAYVSLQLYGWWHIGVSLCCV